MKLVKSLLLGSAAGIAAVASAQAADLPTKKAAPAEYVRVCDAYGAGFFYIPGTQTCLRISGRVRAEYGWTALRNRAPFIAGVGAGAVTRTKNMDQTGMRARGRLNFDVRTQTSWGTLRAFIRLEQTSNRGAVYGSADGAMTLYYAFIQFAGVTAGRAQSFYDFYANDLNWGTLRTSDHNPVLLAYTATFGGGFSATLSVEDKTERGYSAVNAAATGHRLPDLIGALRVDQGWGSAQLSGAVGQRNITFGGFDKNYTIWAVQGGVKFNLPMLAAGDYLWLQAAYSEGGVGTYVLGSNLGIGAASLYNLNQVGGLQVSHTDAIARAVVGGVAVDKTKGWGVLAGGLHYWTPSVRQALYAGYAQINYNNNAKLAGARNANEFRVGTNVIWSPVAGLDIGMELLYAKTSNKLTAAESAAVARAGIKKDPDSFQARLRIQRDF